MNIINKLTLRHMKLNKKRTVVTMIGIVIAVAMITAVSTVAYSVMDYMARDDMIANGYFHLKFANYFYKDNDKILDEMDIENFSLMKPVADYIYETTDSGDVIKPYAYDGKNNGYREAFRIVAVEDNFYEMLRVELIEGNYPKNENELLISDRADVFEDKKVGDKLELGGKEYTICGIIMGDEFEWRELALPGVMTCPMYTKLDRDTLQENDLISGYFYVGGILDNLEDEVEGLCDKLQKSGVPEGELIGEDVTWYCDGTTFLYNYSILQYYGLSKYSNVNVMMDTLKLILIIIVMVGGVSLIANGFMISVSERSKYLGMLASVGATKKQKRNSVYFEGFLEGIIAVPFGILSGILGIAITFKFIEPLVKNLAGTDTELKVIVNSSVIIGAIIFSISTIFLSAYFPAKRASKISAIDAIRQNKDIKMSAKAVKTMGITRKIFGFEGELALKNLKRNKKKYRITVFSMFISLTLFISVYSIVYYAKEGVYFEMGDVSYDMLLSQYLHPQTEGDGIENLELEELFTDISNRLINEADEYIDETLKYSEVLRDNRLVGIEIPINTGLYREAYKEYLDKCHANIGHDVGHTVIPIYMSEKDLKNYLHSIDVDYDDFVADDDNVILYDNVINVMSVEEERLIYNDSALLENLEKLDYTCVLYDNVEVKENGEFAGYERVERETINSKFKIFKRAEKLNSFNKTVIYVLITPNKAMQLKEYGISVYNYLFMNVNNDGKVEEIFERIYDDVLKDKLEQGIYNADIHMTNSVLQVKEVENGMLLISVFAYGFIILMTLICVANIVNTISTSLALRRREFAMIKSVGMTDKAFNRMIAYESAFYGIKAIIFGLPVATAIMLYVRGVVGGEYGTEFGIPWIGYIIAIIGVFMVIGVTMLYSSGKIKKANIIEALRDENA